MSDNLKKKYYIAWVDTSNGNAGHGQPVFSTKEKAEEFAKAMNEEYKGRIVHGVGCV